MQYADQIFSAMIDAVVIADVDSPQLRIVEANEAAHRLLGYDASAGELRGRGLSELFANQDDAKTRRIMRPRAGDEVRKEEVMLRTRDAGSVPASVSISVIAGAAGKSSALLLVARDLRERVALLAELREAKESVERELDKTRRALVRAERLATLGTLAGGVAHELRNIAQVFTGALHELKHIEAGAPVPSWVVEELVLAYEHINAHAHRLLNLAQPGQATLEDLDLGECVRATLSMLNSAGKTKYLSVRPDLPDEPAVIHANRKGIEQVLVNLIINAVDALEDKRPSDPFIRVRVRRGSDGDPGAVVLQITDNGCGIADSELALIFDSFHSTKAPDRGTGLGLVVVRERVEAFDGTITVDSQQGIGTTFTVTFPAAGAAPSRS